MSTFSVNIFEMSTFRIQSQHLWNVNIFCRNLIIFVLFCWNLKHVFFVEMKIFVLGILEGFFTLRQTCRHCLLAKGDFYQKRQIPEETCGFTPQKSHGFIFNTHKFQIFSIFTPILGKWSNMTTIFQMDWFNHQLDTFSKSLQNFNLNSRDRWHHKPMVFQSSVGPEGLHWNNSS